MLKVAKVLCARAVPERHWKKNSVDKQGKTLLLLLILMAGLWGFQYCAEETGTTTRWIGYIKIPSIIGMVNAIWLIMSDRL